ncbi:MAG TPA: hypothetical protein VFX12_02250 [Vicinamibacterales bacterium]|nr:hypothetical protein [Vicinamibacterales bacterium]
MRIVPLRSRRLQRAQMLQKIQHLVPCAALLIAGVQLLGSNPRGFPLALAFIEIGASLPFLVSVLRSLHRMRRGVAGHAHTGSGVDWADVLASGVLGAEALDRWHRTGHIARPQILTAVIILVIGLLHGRLSGLGERRRALRIDDEAIATGRQRPFRRRFRARWDEIVAIEIGEREARIRRRDGRVRRFDLADLENAEEVRRALEGAREELARRNRG